MDWGLLLFFIAMFVACGVFWYVIGIFIGVCFLWICGMIKNIRTKRKRKNRDYYE